MALKVCHIFFCSCNYFYNNYFQNDQLKARSTNRSGDQVPTCAVWCVIYFVVVIELIYEVSSYLISFFYLVVVIVEPTLKKL